MEVNTKHTNTHILHVDGGDVVIIGNGWRPFRTAEEKTHKKLFFNLKYQLSERTVRYKIASLTRN